MIFKENPQGEINNTQLPSEVIFKLRSESNARDVFTTEAIDSFATKGLLESPQMSKATVISPLFNTRSSDNIRGRNFFTREMSSVDDYMPELSGLNVAVFEDGKDASEAVLSLSTNPLVEYAHIPAPREYAVSDPHQNRQWGLRAIDYFTTITNSQFKNANNIRIAILDSGIDHNHPDLKGTFIVNKNFSTLGAKDDMGHGTHVAGIVAAIANNGVGITGTCESNQLIVLRGLTRPYSSVAYYAALRDAMTQNAQVLNCSLGGPYDPTEALIIRTAISRGMIVVAAMGNHYKKNNPTSYPAALPDVIAVGATDEVDRRADFSQTGPHIWISAPGKNILSTVPTYNVSLTSELNYVSWDGTSMATPFVTAAVALMLAKNPSATLTDIKNALAQTAVRPNGLPPGFTNELGHGRLNLAGALNII